ncbi:pirin family protein [Tsukamurella sp. 8F]|uniref:pirin family protein n=1 Tax=unclassified Tsukamurella TaxID=2633480 RepID=UPI0023B9362F|nr:MULTISPECIES: pirin family protein [unclassified Tsukamurella]MDF0531433.1 pirin family protein [Tsukamurella sp. 8J]MDF0587504.1 pirin family protein [Tsukamurella sp. 8F]
MSEIVVVPAEERGFWQGDGIVTRQSFPFTGNFDLAEHAHGLLLVHNDDLVDPAMGVDMHRHRDVEIVTWVVEGELSHRDSSGAGGIVRAGQVQAMSAGSGVTHAETNTAPRRGGTVARVIQMWLPPDTPGGEPSYRTAGVALDAGSLVTVASGMAGHTPAVGIGNDSAALHAARLRPGDTVALPDAPYGHLFVVGGTVDVAEHVLGDGDVLRTTRAGDLYVTGVQDAEILYWEMHAAAISAL